MSRSTGAAKHTAFSDAFGIRMKELREGRNLRQIDMAKLCDVAVATYANWEQGRALPPLNYVPTLVNALETRADYLIGIPRYEKTEALAACIKSLSEKRQGLIADVVDDMMAHRDY